MDVIDDKRIVEKYRELAKLPYVSDARLEIHDDKYVVNTLWKQRDIDRKSNVCFHTIQTTSPETCVLDKGISFPSETPPFQRISSYYDGKLAIIQDVLIDGDKAESQFLEIWNDRNKELSINLTKLKKHGKVHYNVQFGALEWSPDFTKILYVAERKVDDWKSFFDKDTNSEACKKFEYQESWGEQLANCYSPVVCVFDLTNHEVSIMECLPDSSSYGQAVWIDDDNIVVVSWSNEPFRMGLIYSTNRKSSLMSCNVKTNSCTDLINDGNSNTGPRVTKNKSELVFLVSPGEGPHNNCVQLYKLNLEDYLESGKINVCPVVQTKNQNDDFPGLYFFLPQRNCFTTDNKMVLSTAWRSDNVIVIVDLSSGKVTKLTKKGEWIVRDLAKDIIVASHSCPDLPEVIKVGKIESESISWFTTTGTPHRLNIDWKLIPIMPTLINKTYSYLNFECILLVPSNFSSLKHKCLVVNPHGGPHMSYFTSFGLKESGLCELGFAVLQVNYRGSTGFGVDSINSLLGNVGSQDVSDVQQCAERFKLELGCDKVVIMGESHGGFLSLSLIAKFPEFYKAAVVTNPAVDFVTIDAASDIPDWAYCEGLNQKYDYKTLATEEFYKKSLDISPIHQVTKVKAACLFIMGSDDLRATPVQSLRWVQKYKAHGGKCKVLWYEGNNHPVDKVDAEANAFVSMVKWINEN